MCGIAGIWQVDGQKVERRTIERFISALAHRGPDGQGVVIEDDGRLALAHRRLAIFDLSQAGAQPMRSLSGRYEITYNGAVYNFLELRTTLEQNGIRFRTNTDTEVILAAYERWGPQCLLRFNGMWSFAIWDRHLRHLFVARDRFGVKPLYVLVGTRRFAFASELKAFLYLDGFYPSANAQALEARLAGNFSDHILLQGIESIPPGHYLDVTPDGRKYQRWWNTLDHIVSVPSDLRKQAEEFRHLLFDACRLRQRCDVPLATSLSGGLDSSSVLCARAVARHKSDESDRQAQDWRRAFIASFPGTPQDETQHALLAAQRASAIPIVRAFSGTNFRADVDDYLYQFEEIGGLFGAAAWALYREMRRERVAVSLDGLGGDELLGGYTSFVLLALLRSGGLLRAPSRTVDLMCTLRQMQGPGQAERPPNQALLAAFTVPSVRSLAWWHPLARRLTKLEQRHSPIAAAAAEEKAIDALGPLTSTLYRSFHHLLMPRILRNFDAHSMGHGVEVRMPFLDWRVVCYAFSVPDDSKVKGGYSKRLLREAMSGLLPEPIRLRRPKLGFNVPVGHWLTHGLGDWLWDEVNDKRFLSSELWNGHSLLELTLAKRRAQASWNLTEANSVLLAVTTHWWQTRWLRARSSTATA